MDISKLVIRDDAPERPRVSVIMLAYNNARFIRQGIRAICRQKAPFAFQLIVSDDCSTDGTLDIVREMMARYPGRITLMQQERNGGIPHNFLAAMHAARGEFVAMCDGDDYWCSRRKLARMVAAMDADPQAAVCFHRVVNAYMGTGTWSLSNGGQGALTTIDDLCRGNYITNCSSLWRREYCPEPPQWMADLLLCDYAMHLINACHGHIIYIRRPMAVYRKHRQALWSGADERRRLDNAIAVRERALEHLDLPSPARTNLEKALADNVEALRRCEANTLRGGHLQLPLKRRVMKAVRSAVTFFIPLPC